MMGSTGDTGSGCDVGPCMARGSGCSAGVGGGQDPAVSGESQNHGMLWVVRDLKAIPLEQVPLSPSSTAHFLYSVLVWPCQRFQRCHSPAHGLGSTSRELGPPGQSPVDDLGLTSGSCKGRAEII